MQVSHHDSLESDMQQSGLVSHSYSITETKEEGEHTYRWDDKNALLCVFLGMRRRTEPLVESCSQENALRITANRGID